MKLNCDKALHKLEWQAVWGFEETVRETALWYRNYYSKQNNSVAEYTISQVEKYIASAENKGLAWAIK